MMKKSVLITGATSGLGYDFVKLFAADGYDLVLVARNKAKLEEIKKEFQDLSVLTISKDLSIAGAAKEVYEEVSAAGISIDVLVNNAGFGLMGPFHELDIRKQAEMIQLNVTALTELTYHFLPGLKSRKDKARILNVASTAAFQPGPLMAVYYATKLMYYHCQKPWLKNWQIQMSPSPPYVRVPLRPILPLLQRWKKPKCSAEPWIQVRLHSRDTGI
ncbi:SDR family NAD(P)-dependent oxidoreductase [Bacillus infantis]|uniref:SDR family NAD(P)-dependent oxidoreductase n=1 Tax=Bacillus infantis TaxID=324767 RepID=UPI003CF6619E